MFVNAARNFAIKNSKEYRYCIRNSTSNDFNFR